MEFISFSISYPLLLFFLAAIHCLPNTSLGTMVKEMRISKHRSTDYSKGRISSKRAITRTRNNKYQDPMFRTQISA